jgi:hypothetical protein
MDAANVNFEQDREKLARELAQDLSGEFGGEIVAETEKQLDPDQQGKRAFGLGVSEARASRRRHLLRAAWSDRRSHACRAGREYPHAVFSDGREPLSVSG